MGKTARPKRSKIQEWTEALLLRGGRFIAIAIAGLTLSLVLVGETGRPNETKIERMQRKFGKDCEIKRTLASRYHDESWAQSPHFLKRYCTLFGV